MEPEGSLPCSQQPIACPSFHLEGSNLLLRSHFFKIRFHTSLPSTFTFSSWFLSFRFPYENPVCISLPPPHPPHTTINPSLQNTIKGLLNWIHKPSHRCVISGFSCEVGENCTLLSCYAVTSGNFIPTFRDNLSVPSPGFKNSKTWFLNPEDGICRLSRNVGKKLQLLAA